jgi:hypothetical protein
MMDVMKDKRRFPRRPVNFKVNVTFSNRESCVLKARDISQGGMYIVSDNLEQPYMGELLHIKLVDEPHIKENIPYEDAVVVHKGRSGFGLSFVENNEAL